MDRVFILQHVHTLPGGEEDVKLIGVYRDREAAMAAVGRLCVMPGFRDHPEVVDTDTAVETDGFYVGEYRLDSDHWAEGFVTIS